MLIPRPISKLSLQYWILALLLVILFLTGGSSRADAQSLAIVHPLSVILCGGACISLRREHVTGRHWLLGWVCVIFALVLIQLIPLPAPFWQSLASRQDIVSVEKLTGNSEIARALTLAPTGGWHAVLSLFTPLALILWGAQLDRDDLFALLPLIVILATSSGILGLLQTISDPQGFLYLYRITNNGAAVGIFANRNHAATLLACLFPILAVYASTARGNPQAVRIRQLIAVAIAIVLVPLILVTGSRSGLVGAVIGLVAAVILYQGLRSVRRDKRNQIRILPILAGFGLISLGLLTHFLSRAEAIERLFSEPSSKAGRTDFWAVSVDLFWKHLPWGSGPGSFVEAYQVLAPAKFLNPYYVNHAHNDWVETAVAFGIPGIIAMSGALVAFGIRSCGLWRRANGSKRTVAFGRLASVIMVILGVTSVFDYPLRTPVMMGLFAICALWLIESGREGAASSK